MDHSELVPRASSEAEQLDSRPSEMKPGASSSVDGGISSVDDTRHDEDPEVEHDSMRGSGSPDSLRGHTRQSGSIPDATSVEEDCGPGGPDSLDDEDESAVVDQLTAEVIGYEARSLAERRKDGKKRSLQSSQYLLLVEERLRELEETVKALKAELEGTERDLSEHATAQWVPPPSPTLPREPSKLLWKDFFAANNTSPWAIDFLVEPPYPLWPLLGVGLKRNKRAQIHQGGDCETKIERLRLKWSDTATILEDLMADGGWGMAGEHLQPFKAIVPFFGKLVTGLSDLDDQIAALPGPNLEPVSATLDQDDHVAEEPVAGTPRSDTAAQDPIVDSQRDPNVTALSEKRQSLQEKRVLLSSIIEHLSTGLADEIESHHRLRSRSRKTELGKPSARVAFSELWHLYAPGDLVYWHDQMQAYRVLAVRGGRAHLAQEPARYPETVPVADGSKAQYAARLKPVGDISGFVITCFHLNSNGTYVGPVQIEVIIEHFEGTREISDLVLTPIEYADVQSLKLGPSAGLTDDHHDLQSFLLARGKSFAKLAHSGELGMYPLRLVSVCIFMTDTELSTS